MGFQIITVMRSPIREATKSARMEAISAQLGDRLATLALLIPSLVRLSMLVGRT